VTEHDVRFTGGPFYWRKRRRGTTMLVSDETQEIKVVGLVRPITYNFHSPAEFWRDVEKGAVTARTGTYRRVEMDRFRWIGWD
jgi:hypothetical protein